MDGTDEEDRLAMPGDGNAGALLDVEGSDDERSRPNVTALDAVCHTRQENRQKERGKGVMSTLGSRRLGQRVRPKAERVKCL